MRVTDLRAHAVVRNYEWGSGFADAAVCAYPEFDVSRGGDAVVGQGNVVVGVFVTGPVLPADVDNALSFSGNPSAAEWAPDYEEWLSLEATGEDPRPVGLGGKSREFTFGPDQPGPFTVKVAGSLPLGGSTTLGQDVVVTITRATEPLVSLEGVEYPHVKVAAPSAGADPGLYARRFTLPPGTWHFRATFGEPMDRQHALPGGILPEGWLEVRQDPEQPGVRVSARWEDSTRLLVTVEADEAKGGRVAVFFDGLEAISGGRVAAQGGLDLQFAPAAVLTGYAVGPEAGEAIEWPFPVSATRGAVAPDGRHALLWEAVTMEWAEASYTLGYPWLLDLLSGRALPVDLTAGWEISNAGWRDSQTVFLCTSGGLYRLDVSSEGEGPAPSDVAPTPLVVYTPEEPSWIQGFGISPDRKTVVLAEPGTLLFLDASTLQIASRTEAAFPDGLFCDPGTEWSWSLPITWIPGRSAIALERINDGVQSVFAVPSGQAEQTVFSGRGGQDVTSVIAWSPDGQAVLAARPTLAIVTGTGETPLASAWQVDDRIKKLPDGAFSPSGNYVAIGYQGKVYVHSAATGALEDAFDGRLLNWSAEEDRAWVIREVGRPGPP